ncbi:MAG TPA: hypothetical protein VIF60_01625 [Burkholderiaceae bacterium]
MRKNNLLLRSVDNGLKVFCRNDQIGELRRAANKDKDLLMLEFKVFPRDRRFAQYTSPIAPNQDAILYFDSWRAVRDKEGRLRLHGGDVVTADFFEDWRSPLIQTAVTAKEAVIRPFFIVNLAINDIGENLPDGQTVTVPQKATTYYLNFASQASYWKYYFLGDIASRDLFIADLSGAMEFTRLGIADVVNGKALAFLSTASIPMQYIPSQRFQLRENGAMGEKVLIKRLPNASVGQIHKEMIKQDAVLVSEMYIN